MKKLIGLLFVSLFIFGCNRDDDFLPVVNEISDELKISESIGLRLEKPFVTDEVSMNVKIDKEQVLTIRIFDISNRVVSRETITVKVGDNILKVYTSALPSSSYRIGIFDSKNKQLGITDFNKL
jgi:hypothetical protein